MDKNVKFTWGFFDALRVTILLSLQNSVKSKEKQICFSMSEIT